MFSPSLGQNCNLCYKSPDDFILKVLINKFEPLIIICTSLHLNLHLNLQEPLCSPPLLAQRPLCCLYIMQYQQL